MHCQFKLPTDDKEWAPNDSDTLARDDGMVAQIMAMLAAGIVGHRLKRQLYILRGWPGRCAFFLGGAESQRQALACWRADVAAYEVFRAGSGHVAGCKAIADRCLSQDVATEQIMDILRVEE